MIYKVRDLIMLLIAGVSAGCLVYIVMFLDALRKGWLVQPIVLQINKGVKYVRENKERC